MNQFVVKSFARGVKLTTQHVWTPAQTMATALGNANVQGQVVTAPFKQNWNFSPMAAAYSGEDANAVPVPIVPKIVLPMIFPPPQDQFNVVTKTYTNSPVLTEMSIGLDQRANPYGITDYSTGLHQTPDAAAAHEGLLTAADLTRYDMTLTLIEKTPTIFDVAGDSGSFLEVLVLEFPGEALFGSAQFNPYVIDGLSVNMNPYKSYYWAMHVKQLPTTATVATVADLAMPSFTLVCTFGYPLETRDFADSVDPTSANYVQNIPTKHLGKKQTKAFTLTPPVAGNPITGDDVQDAVHSLEAPILDKLRAGYGNIVGQEADVFPWEQLAKDTGYQIINVPMFANWWDARSSDLYVSAVPPLAGCGFPYLGATVPFIDPVVDQRVLSIPTGFVVHHIIACQNTYPYPSAVHAGWGTTYGDQNLYDPNTDYTLCKVGVAMFTGLRGDNQQYQQVGYLAWDNATLAAHQIDRLKLDNEHTNMITLNVPLVWDADREGFSYTSSGKPVFLGGGNTTTAARTPIANAPFAFGGTTFDPPKTAGGESLLVVRWSMQNPNNLGPGLAGGLSDQFSPIVRAGWGGHQIIIIGKQSTLGQDSNDASGNGTTGQW